MFRDAVKENCLSIIAVHNHPSGDPTPSPDDVAVTRDLIAGGRFVSLKAQRLGFR